MPIITLQRQLRELGRIRTGNQVAMAGGKRRPAKLETFRLTSESLELITAAAAAYGGSVTPWQNGDHAEYEVVTTTAVLDIVVPPGQPVSQWYEMWSGGGCQRRCDGVTNVLDMTPCACPTDVQQRIALAARGEACKATTRLNVILPALPDLGVFRLESHGYYAAVELAGAAEILAMASATGRLIPARLRLEQREKKEPGKPTKKWAVPIIEFVETRMADLQLTGPAGAAPQLTSGRPAIPALPAATLPTTSDFRAPVAAAVVVEDPEPEDATDTPFVETLRAAAALQDGTATQATPEQIAKVREGIFAGWNQTMIATGIEAAFGTDAKRRPTIAHLAALTAVAEQFGAEAFKATWEAMVAVAISA